MLTLQRLTEVNHPDHTLITYPNLGHQFYPSEWLTGVGPFEQMFYQISIHGLKLILTFYLIKIILAFILHFSIRFAIKFPHSVHEPS